MDNAVSVLKFSEEKCRAIGIKEEYTPDELDRFESLTSRFARLCDILLQKVFRLVDEIDLDLQSTLRDRINRAARKKDDFLPDEISKLLPFHINPDVNILLQKCYMAY